MNTLLTNTIAAAIKLLSIFVVIYLLNTALFFALPKTGVEQIQADELEVAYASINLQRSFALPPAKQKRVQNIKRESVDSFILKAIYAYSDNTGYIMIAHKKSPNKTELLGINDRFKGYKLIKIFSQRVIFSKNNKEYELYLNKKAKLQKGASLQKPTLSTQNDKQEVKISKNVIKKYTKDFDAIWKSIAIKEVKDKNGNINGFEIIHIRKNSVFANLGLKPKDIIKKVNNITLKSYADAFRFYNDIDSYRSLNIQILRNNKEMEINYEIQ